jgi:hypothetical protein
MYYIGMCNVHYLVCTYKTQCASLVTEYRHYALIQVQVIFINSTVNAIVHTYNYMYVVYKTFYLGDYLDVRR